MGLGGLEGSVPMPGAPRANQNTEAASDLGSPPWVLSTACSLACHSYLLRPTELPSTAWGWMLSGPNSG